ncbi:MAG TPA: glycosyltransferase [Anaerolineales bacterium]|nr:glycosyltransferase [Anaerolineales bacterium]
MNIEIQKPKWTSTSSIHTINFKSKPVLDDISIVIPTLGREILEQSLFWILSGSAWPGCLIVVEQGSNPTVSDWLNRLQEIGIRVKHVSSDQRGRSAGINRGLEQVDTHFVAITDDDCFVGEDWLINMANKLQSNPDAVVTGRVEAAGEDMVVVVTSITPSIQNRPRLKFDSMSGGNMGTSRAVFKKVGLFEEDPVMPTAEDAEWSYRALRKGVSIRYEPAVVVAHFGWRDEQKRVEQYRHYALSHGGFYGKYIRRGDLFILARAAGHFMRALRRWINGKVNGDAESALLGRSYCLNLLPGILAGMHSSVRPGELK